MPLSLGIIERCADDPPWHQFPLHELVWNQLAQDLTRLRDVLVQETLEVLGPVGQSAFNPFEVERSSEWLVYGALFSY